MATTWNPATASGGIVLSGGNLVASNPSSGATDEFAYSTTTGTKVYFEVVATTDAGGSNAIGIGVVDSSFTGSVFLGGDTHSCSWYDSTTVYYNGSPVGNPVSYTTADNVGIAVDAPNKLIWVRKNGGTWNLDVGGANPATGTGGYSLSSIGSPIMAAVTLRTTQGSTVTAKFASASFTYTAPAGFSPFTPASVVTFRLTLSPVGTRTGSRQVIG